MLNLLRPRCIPLIVLFVASVDAASKLRAPCCNTRLHKPALLTICGCSNHEIISCLHWQSRRRGMCLLPPPLPLSHCTSQEITIEGRGLMGPDKVPPLVTIGGRECGVIPFLSERAQIVCTAPAHPEHSSLWTWKNILVVTAAGKTVKIASSCWHSCQVQITNRMPIIQTVLNPQIDGTDVLGVFSQNSHLKTISIPSEMVMKIGDARCQTHDETGEQTLAQQYGDVWYDAVTANEASRIGNRRRRQGYSDDNRKQFSEHRAYCEYFLA